MRLNNDVQQTQKEKSSFFSENYDVIAKVLPQSHEKKFMIDKDIFSRQKFCRFCGKNDSQAKFRDDAHAIPAMLGNKTVFLASECDDCNHFFGETLEDSFSKYLGISRTLSQIPGRKGSPSYKSADGKFRMDIASKGAVIQSAKDSSVPDLHEEHIDFHTEREPYYPIDVFRMLLLSAMSVIPVEEWVNFTDTCLLIRADRKTDEGKNLLAAFQNFITPYAANVFEVFMPGPSPLPLGVTVMRRKNSTKKKAPYAIGILQFSNFRFQFMIPCRNDSELDGCEVTIPLFDEPDDYTFSEKYGLPSYKVADLSSYEKKRGDKSSMRLNVGGKIEIPPSKAVEIIQRLKVHTLDPSGYKLPEA